MTAIPRAAEAMTSASGRFERASARLLEAASGAGKVEPVDALVAMQEAKLQYKAAVAVVRFSDETWNALVEIGQETDRQ